MANSTTDMKARIQTFDWSSTPLGPMEAWPQELKTTAAIVEDSSVPMLLLWGSDGTMIFNDAYAGIAGARHHGLLGAPVERGWPELAEFNREVLDKVLAGKSLSYRDKYFAFERGGTPKDVWMNLDYSPVKDEQGNPVGVLAIVAETTAWIYAERAQRESESRFRTLADNIAQFAWMADRSGSIFWYNKRWFEYTGATLDEMRGWGWKKVHHPDHVDRVVEKISHCFRTGEDWEDTFPLRGLDGNYRWFLSRASPIRDADGNVVRWIGTNTDITAQREEAERNAQLAAIVSTSADAIISLSPTGIVQSWNPGAERVFGYGADEIVGKSERILFAEDADEEFEEKYQTLRHGQTVLRDAIRLRKDGTPINVAINAAPIRDIEGEIIGFSAVLRDITERKRVERHLRVVMRELSHRTKNLLAVIIAMVRQTSRTSSDVDVLQKHLIDRLQSLSASHDLLVKEDWAGASLQELVAAVLQPFIGDSSDALEISGPSVFVSATAAQNLGLALHELATNAAKYGALSVPTGRIEVTCSFEPEAERGEPRLQVKWTERGGPTVQQPTTKGFGHVMIERVAPQALNARASYEFPNEGVRWTIIIPLDFVVRWRSEQDEEIGTPAS